MADKPWKKAERRVAEMFGCRRQVLSGSGGRDDRSCSDSTHEVLFIECKYRISHTARTLWDATKKFAMKERKLPVIALVCKGRPGFLVAIHSDDFPRVVAEYLKVGPGEEWGFAGVVADYLAGLSNEDRDAIAEAVRRRVVARETGVGLDGEAA